MSFKKINVGNDWMSLYYSFGPVLDEYGSASYRLGTLHFKNGDSVRVRWPNGKEETTTIVLRTERSSYFEQGQRNETWVSNDVPHVRVDANGIEQFVPLTSLEVWDDDS